MFSSTPADDYLATFAEASGPALMSAGRRRGSSRMRPVDIASAGGTGSGRDAGMAEMMTTDVRAIMDRSPFDVAAVADLREVLNRDPSRYRTLREAVANIRDREKKEKENKPETHLRLGVGEVLAGSLPVRARAPEESRRCRDGLLLPRPRPGEPATLRAGRRGVRAGGQARL